MSDFEITDDAKRDVLAATDLVALVGGTTALKKAGASWKGLCPFHTEKTPSFHVHPEKGFYYCFGCGAKGDAITFVRETEKMEYPEAVAYLARLAGVRLPPRRHGTRAERGKETGTAEAVAAAAAFFRAQLAHHAGAKELLAKRGISGDDAALYGFGAAPDSWDALKATLAPRFPEEVLVEAGLLQKHPDSGRVYDRFRNRLTVEIRDARGEVLGFGARALGDEQPKYLNSPESSRFSKGRLLYGLDRAKEAVRRAERVVLCEGYFDRIAFERAGRSEAVASMGTALTPAQADLLVRHSSTVVVAYDSDEAGEAATKKAFALLLERNAAVKKLVLPGAKDPDELLKAGGPAALAAALEKAPGVVEALVAGVPARGGDPATRAAALSEAVAILRSPTDPILRHELLDAFSRAVGVPLATLVPRPGKKTAPEPVENAGRSAPEAAPGGEERVLAILLAEWPESAQIARRIPPEIFLNPSTRELFTALRELPSEGQTLDFSALASHVGADAGQLAARLLLLDRDRVRPENLDEEAAGGLGRLHKPLLQLKIRHLEEKGRALQREIEREPAGVPGGQELRREKQMLAAEVHRLKRELCREGDGAPAKGER